ncbi:transcription factor TGAL3-like isoform X1 [Miscanthus floridulus]|uniref:transcription factor TGAL3-like isoform X1 n=1 Tax=Miscanthus floridulus TaxID=154761 RepID=UPI00345A6872
MALPGVATTADDARFCMPWAAAAHFENWGDSGIVVTSPLAETASTDVDDVSGGNHNDAQMGGAITQSVDGHDNSLPVCKVESRDHKAQRRLAQNREAARKSRMRKKAYIVELENSRSKLAHLEQELQRARQQGMFIASGRSGDHGGSTGGSLAFDLEYARWLDEHQHHMNDLRVALSAQIGDDDLGVLVDGVMLHYDEMFRLKGVATRTDVFHVLSGMWMSPAERFFMWLGGFRSSELLKVVARQVEPQLTEQQLVGICSLQQSLQQAEDALSQGMEALQQALGDTLAAAAPALGPSASAADSVTNYMGQMAVAMSKLATVENFLRQADLLRQQTLKQVHRILTTRQAARALLVVSDYFSRLRALSSLWLTRPTD